MCSTGFDPTCLNWTKVGLKDDNIKNREVHELCLNWTKVGLKGDYYIR